MNSKEKSENKSEIITIDQLKKMDIRNLVNRFLNNNSIPADAEIRKKIGLIMLDIISLSTGEDNDWSLSAMAMDTTIKKNDDILNEIKELFQNTNCSDSQQNNYNSAVYMKLAQLVDLIIQPNKSTEDYQEIAKICDINLGIPRTTFPLSNRHPKLHDILQKTDKIGGEISR